MERVRTDREHDLREAKRVLLDADLADLYGVETRALKQAVRRNIARFPPDFMIELTPDVRKRFDDYLQRTRSALRGAPVLPIRAMCRRDDGERLRGQPVAELLVDRTPSIVELGRQRRVLEVTRAPQRAPGRGRPPRPPDKRPCSRWEARDRCRPASC